MAKPVFSKLDEIPEHWILTDSDGGVWVGIGLMHGKLENVPIIEELLAKIGIRSRMEGSVMYSITVLQADVQRALDFLKNYEDASEYGIHLYGV